MAKHAAEFDAFFITRFYVARDVIDRLRDLAPQARILFNNADLHFLRELRAGVAAGDPEKIEAARRTREVELEVMRKTDVVLSYNEVEHSVIQSHTDGRFRWCNAPGWWKCRMRPPACRDAGGCRSSAITCMRPMPKVQSGSAVR